MTDDKNNLEKLVQACYGTWGERYYDDYYAQSDAYPPVHIDIVRELLAAGNFRTVLDAGCGPASMLRHLDLPGIQRYGFDLTPEMVAEARRIMAAQGVSDSRIWQGSVLDAAAFSAPVDHPAGGFDSTVCFGVLPHIPAADDRKVLRNLRDALRPGGIMAVEARNELFSLFTQNRYSHDFFRSRLVDEAALRAAANTPEDNSHIDDALAAIGNWFRMDLPPVRKGYADEPGYDQILSRTHNPFELAALARAEGLVDVETLFYHYHVLPPMLESSLPQVFRKASLAMENGRDWRGHFMASAFVVVAKRPQ